MKKLNSQYNKLNDMAENIKGIISDLEACVEHIEDAMSCLEYYTD